MISFYPGPSRVYDQIPGYVKDAFKEGVLSINHRSEEFVRISERTIYLLKQKLGIPSDYTIFYTSSATECWEIIGQSVTNKRSYHLFNGAFGQKWFEYTKRICSGVRSYPFDQEEIVNAKKLRFGATDGVICITQNETSNGTQVSHDIIHEIKNNNPEHLVAVDATSSLGGIHLNFRAADIWFASVQKCLGLPAGMALMISSPKAIEKTKFINERDHYNSLAFMTDMMEKFQTPFTPNVLNIYLLMRVMEKVKPIADVHEKVFERYQQWIAFLKEKKSIQHLIGNRDAHSYTVIPVVAKEELVKSIKSRAKKNGFLLGEGYGELKSATFRIANFPALKKSEIKSLRAFLDDYA